MRIKIGEKHRIKIGEKHRVNLISLALTIYFDKSVLDKRQTILAPLCGGHMDTVYAINHVTVKAKGHRHTLCIEGHKQK